MCVTVSHSGYIKRNAISLYRAQRRAARQNRHDDKSEDIVTDLFIASTTTRCSSSRQGVVYWLKVHQSRRPDAHPRKAIVNLVNMAGDERVPHPADARLSPATTSSSPRATASSKDGNDAYSTRARRHQSHPHRRNDASSTSASPTGPRHPALHRKGKSIPSRGRHPRWAASARQPRHPALQG